jgi:hypothetical protein
VINFYLMMARNLLTQISIANFTKRLSMTALENIKNGLIDRILATQNEKLLQAIQTIFEASKTEEIVDFSREQVRMIMMAKEDVAAGRLISEEDLKASDPEWLH